MAKKNLADEFERVAGEPIDYATLTVGWGAEGEREMPSPEEIGKVLHWDDVRHFLDYEYDSGGWDGPKVTISAMAWSESWVVYVHEYDSSHTVGRVPRFPEDGPQVGAPIGGDGW